MTRRDLISKKQILLGNEELNGDSSSASLCVKWYTGDFILLIGQDRQGLLFNQCSIKLLRTKKKGLAAHFVDALLLFVVTI